MSPDQDSTSAEPPSAPPGPLSGRLSPAKGRSRWVDIAFAVAALVAVAGISFAGGRLTAPAARAAGFGGRGDLGGPGGSFAPGGSAGAGFRGGGGFGGVQAFEGAVVEITADHLTIKLDSGQTLQIPVSATTAYHSQAAASASDVHAGGRVLIQLQPRVAGSTGAPTGQLAPASEITLISP
jgi:hypothetical protein